MKLQEVIDQLTGSELSQLSIGGQSQGVINENNQLIVVNAINLGLSNLHTRFNLKEGKLKLLLIPGKYQYILKSAYALNNSESRENVRYIEGDFEDDLAKVEAVFTENDYELELNTRRNYSCSTPNTTVLVVPAPIVDQDMGIPSYLQTDALNIVYRANHPKIVSDEFGVFDFEKIEVDLPYPYLEPLLYFVASRVHHPMGMQADSQMGASYYAKYDQACQRLQMSNVAVDQGAGNDRLIKNGWV